MLTQRKGLVIGVSDLVDLWVIKIKSPWSFSRVVRQNQVNRARTADHTARTCERFVPYITKITRSYDCQTWQTFFEKFTKCPKVCGLFSSIVFYGCWLAGQAIFDHMTILLSSRGLPNTSHKDGGTMANTCSTVNTLFNRRHYGYKAVL